MSAVRNGISWWYNWGDVLASAETQHQQDGIEYVSMIWNGVDLNSVSNTISSIPQGVKYLLGFNEPNFYAQANMPATTAASLWPKMEQVANSRNLKIVSPAVNYCGGGCWETDPFVYLDEFFAACTNCQVDYVAAHVYSCTADALQDYLTNLKKYGKPIWITEIACAQWDSAWQNNQQFITDYMKEAVEILESDPQVFRYAWFSGRTTGIPMVNVFGNTGQLTDLGQSYVTMPCGSFNAELSESSAGENTSTTLSSTSWVFVGLGVCVGIAFLVVLMVFVVKRLKTHAPVEIV